MFGSFRFLLALMVATAHLGFDPVVWWGMYAVFGFYTLSGYLMTLVLHERYWRSGRGGTARFLTNRALRIYPPYLLMTLLALGMALALPAASPRLLPGLPLLPASPREWLANVGIFGLTSATRLIQPSWSLDVELQLYLAMAALLARSRWTIAIWCLSSLAYTGYLVATGTNIAFRYIPVPAASLPFSLGSALYLLRDRLPRVGGRVCVAAVVIFALHAVLARVVWTNIHLGGFYTSLALVVVAVAALQSLDERTHPAGAIDRFLGDLAYPLFLGHMQVIGFVRWAAPSLSAIAPGAFAAASLLSAMGLAWSLHRATEVPLAPLRKRLGSVGGTRRPTSRAPCMAGGRRSSDSGDAHVPNRHPSGRATRRWADRGRP